MCSEENVENDELTDEDVIAAEALLEPDPVNESLTSASL